MSLIEDMQRFTSHLEASKAARGAFVGNVRQSVEEMRGAFRLESRQRRDDAQRRARSVASQLNAFRQDFAKSCDEDAAERQTFHEGIQDWVDEVRGAVEELQKGNAAEDRARIAETVERAKRTTLALQAFAKEFATVCVQGDRERATFVAEVQRWVDAVRQAVETLRDEHRTEQKVRGVEAKTRAKTVAAELQAFAAELQDVSEQGDRVREAFLNHVENWVGNVRQTTADLRKQFVVERAVVCTELQSFRRLWMNHLVQNAAPAAEPAPQIPTNGETATENLQGGFLSVLAEQRAGMRLSEVGDRLNKPWQQLTSIAAALLDEGKIVKRRGAYFLPDDAPEEDAPES